MPGMPHCYLTTKDYSILERILDTDTRCDELLRRMLRQKLSAATIVFPDDISPGIARIDSRIEFSVDRRFSDNRILVHGDGGSLSGLALPVTSPHGLALLGMSEGDATVIETRDGGMQELRLDRIWSQPESLRKHEPGERPAKRNTVIAFTARRPPVGAMVIPDDDDPGPAAA